MHWPTVIRPGVQKLLTAAIVATFLAFGAFGLWRLVTAPAGPLALLGALFSFSPEAIRVSANPNPVAFGEPVAFTWEHEGKTADGSYELSYPCRGEVRLLVLSGFEVPCNASFPVGGKRTIALIPDGDRAAPAEVRLTVAFRQNDSAERGVAASILLMISPPAPASAPLEAPAAAPLHSAPPLPRPQPVVVEGPTTRSVFSGTGFSPPIDPQGIPDLTMAVVAVGAIDGATGAFSATSSVRRVDQIGIVFEVTNVGTALSSPWHFTAILPTVGGGFTAPIQLPLAPGDRVRFTIGFRSPNQAGANAAVFTIDPANALRDANRANDVATATVIVRDE